MEKRADALSKKTDANMFASKREIFENARKRWPLDLNLALRPSRHGSVLTEPSSLEIYNDIERGIEKSDEWAQLAAWAFHQAFSSLIKDRYECSHPVIIAREVSFESFDEMMRSNLAHESWRDERAIYLSLP